MRSAAARALRDAGFRGSLACDERLAPYTTWRIGGPAELLASPLDPADLACALRWAAAGGTAWRILGNGSNLLVRDEGVPGLTLRLRRTLDGYRREEDRLIVGAGASFPAIARRAAAAGLAGLEFGAGIPGTLGGAVVMNAGWHEFEIGASVTRVDVLDQRGERLRFDVAREPDAFRYRGSRFRDAGLAVTEAELRLAADDPEAIRERMERFAASRKANQPTELASCGSVFLKPEGDFAGRLIEAAGLKGAREGAVEVSNKHANFFVNRGGATADDVLRLVERVEAEVERRFGVRLTREFEIWPAPRPGS